MREPKSLTRMVVETFLTWSIVANALGNVVAFAITHGAHL